MVAVDRAAIDEQIAAAEAPDISEGDQIERFSAGAAS